MRVADRIKTRLFRIPVYRAIADQRLRWRSTEAIFRDIVAHDKWRGSESLSGPGSSLDETRIVVAELPVLLRDLGVRSVLDLPCGDFHWMRRVDLTGIDYHGADILTEVVEQAASENVRPGVRFSRLDLLVDRLPTVDLVLSRDCLVHFSNADVFSALRNLCASGSTYLLTTTYTGRSSNGDIVTGRWRPLDLEAAPFRLPRPEHLIRESPTSDGGAWADKSLGLWRLGEIRRVIDEGQHRARSGRHGSMR